MLVVARALRLNGRAPLPLARPSSSSLPPHLGGNVPLHPHHRRSYRDQALSWSFPMRRPGPSHRLAARKPAKVQPGILSHLVTGEPPVGKSGQPPPTQIPTRSQTQRELMLRDEMGDFEIGDEDVPPVTRRPRQPGPPRQAPQDRPQQKRRPFGLRQEEEVQPEWEQPRHEKWEQPRQEKWEQPRQEETPKDVPVWGKGKTWRDLDTARLEPLKHENIITLPAHPDGAITAAHSARVEKVSVWYPLFYGTSVPAAHIPGGGAPDMLPPFDPPMRNGILPDGRQGPADPSSPFSRHLADTSPDARAGTGFAYPVPATETEPGKVRVFVLAPKSKLSRLSVERRRCRNRFLSAWRHVVNRTEGVPPLSHKRVYSFVLNAEIYEAPFTDICEFIDKAIRELHHKLTAPRVPKDRQRVQNLARRGPQRPPQRTSQPAF